MSSRPLASAKSVNPAYVAAAHPSPVSVAALPVAAPATTGQIRSQASPPSAVGGSAVGWTPVGGSPIVLAEGDTLNAISGRYGVPVPALLSANGLHSASEAHGGMRLIVPVYNAGGKSAPRVVEAPAEASAIRSKRAEAEEAKHDEDKHEAKAEEAKHEAKAEEAKHEARADEAKHESKSAKAKAKEKEDAEDSDDDSKSRLKAKKKDKQKDAEADTEPKTRAEAKAEKAALAKAEKAGPEKVEKAAVAKADKTTSEKAEKQAAAKADKSKAVAEASSKPAAVVAEAETTKAGRKKAAQDPTPTGAVAAAAPAAAVTSAQADASGAAPEFRWPARGRIIQGFKSGGNDGINIAVPEGTSVRAAEDGKVAYAGSALKGYGNLVLIRHPNGFVSAYANNGELNVKNGDTVKRGQVIAKSGQTGDVSSPQLHFELRKGSTPVDPTNYLAGL